MNTGLKLKVTTDDSPPDVPAHLETLVRNLGRINPNDLEIMGDLGEGAGGSVVKCKHKVSGQIWAVKNIQNFTAARTQEVTKELKALMGNECPELVALYGAYEDKNGGINLCLEYMDSGSLQNAIDVVGSIPETILQHIVLRVLRALNFLHHTRHFIHRDIKPSNILIDSNGNVKLTDFGVGGQIADTLASTRTFIGTVYYMAPERLNGQSYTASADIWSLGLLVVQCAIGTLPFESGACFWQLLQEVQNKPPPSLPPDRFSPEMDDFVRQCLIKDGSERPTSQQLLQHSWMLSTEYTDPQRFQTHYKNWLKRVQTKLAAKSMSSCDVERILKKSFDNKS